MKRIAWALIMCMVLVLSSSGCSSTAKPTASSNVNATGTPKPSAAASVVTTPLARPAGGKAQELTFPLKTPTNAYNMVIFLSNGETLDLDWKFVANPQVGIRFMFTTPEGREMDTKLQPVNLAGHPLFDQNLPSQKLEELVGSHVEIKVGMDKYCSEGYYSLIFSGNPAQSGTVYLRYSIIPAAK